MSDSILSSCLSNSLLSPKLLEPKILIILCLASNHSPFNNAIFILRSLTRSLVFSFTSFVIICLLFVHWGLSKNQFPSLNLESSNTGILPNNASEESNSSILFVFSYSASKMSTLFNKASKHSSNSTQSLSHNSHLFNLSRIGTEMFSNSFLYIVSLSL